MAKGSIILENRGKCLKAGKKKPLLKKALNEL
jgi:hypothetical protein